MSEVGPSLTKLFRNIDDSPSRMDNNNIRNNHNNINNYNNSSEMRNNNYVNNMNDDFNTNTTDRPYRNLAISPSIGNDYEVMENICEY